MPTRSPLHLAVALDGAGWHPAAWRAPDARPRDLFTARYWLDLVLEAERGLLDFVTFEDRFALQSSRIDGPDGRVDQVRGRLDAAVLAARLGPATSHIGLVPTVTTTHTEPFHVATAIATLDYVSTGRAGWRAQISGFASEAVNFGRRVDEFPAFKFEDRGEPATLRRIADNFDEAADVVEVVRRLWDSWEDDAVIRDAATGRFIDRDKLHYADFSGRWFNVKGPSITPRPPQGQPVVVSLSHIESSHRFAARSSDVIFLTPHDADQATKIIGDVREQEADTGRPVPLRTWADLVVFLDDDASTARDRGARLDDLDGAAYASDAEIFTGTPDQLADLLLAWQDAGVEGYRLRPAALPHDLHGVTRGLVPALRARGAFRSAYEATTLRGLLGLARPANRFAAA
jgi:alkanesulfonate monooxygenase SsuD/methylene tetrahydromethanopterin reductase-like flavin-dependent oxidoreductase (luciferase family)